MPCAGHGLRPYELVARTGRVIGLLDVGSQRPRGAAITSQHPGPTARISDARCAAGRNAQREGDAFGVSIGRPAVAVCCPAGRGPAPEPVRGSARRRAAASARPTWHRGSAGAVAIGLAVIEQLAGSASGASVQEAAITHAADALAGRCSQPAEQPARLPAKTVCTFTRWPADGGVAALQEPAELRARSHPRGAGLGWCGLH